MVIRWGHSRLRSIAKTRCCEGESVKLRRQRSEDAISIIAPSQLRTLHFHLCTFNCSFAIASKLHFCLRNFAISS